VVGEPPALVMIASQSARFAKKSRIS
jgi:hypothetical protein